MRVQYLIQKGMKEFSLIHSFLSLAFSYNRDFFCSSLVCAAIHYLLYSLKKCIQLLTYLTRVLLTWCFTITFHHSECR